VGATRSMAPECKKTSPGLRYRQSRAGAKASHCPRDAFGPAVPPLPLDDSPIGRVIGHVDRVQRGPFPTRNSVSLIGPIVHQYNVFT